MKLSQAVKDYIIHFKDDLKKNNLDNLFGVEFDNLFSQTKQEVIDAFINSNVDIFGSLTEICGATFRRLTLPTDIISPNVLDIGNHAFERTNIEKIYAPKCEYIGVSAFEDCKNLKSVYAPNVNQLGGYIFANCDSLTELSLPKVDIESCAGLVVGCTHLKKLYLPNCEPPSDYTVEEVICVLFGDLDYDYTFDLEELYIKDNGSNDADIEIAEKINKCMPKLKVIDAGTGIILRDYIR